MKTKLAVIITTFIFAISAFASTNCVTITWALSPSDIGPSSRVYKLYHSTNIALPFTNWTAIATAPSQSTNATIAILPGVHHFCLTYNDPVPGGWGESIPSNIVSTPPDTQPPGALTIRIGQ